MSNIIIPSSPKDQEDIFAVIKEISNSMMRQEAERDYQKEAFKELAEKYEIDAKLLKRIARDYHKDAFKKVVGETEDYTLLYETIIKD